MILDKRDFSSPQPTATLLISVENTISDLNSFFQAIHSVKRRFGFNISIVFKHPELLFFNKRMMSAVANAEIDRALITDAAEFIWLDSIEFAKRQETDYVAFTEAESLAYDFPENLKFITSFLYSDFDFKRDNALKFIACKQSYLRTLASDKFESYKDLIQSITEGQPKKEKKKPSTSGDFSLFISKVGLNRFGGEEKFKQIKELSFGEKSISRARKIWQLDNQMNIAEFFSQDHSQMAKSELVTIPGILAETSAYQIIVDINPGSGVELNRTEQGALHIPRMLLTINVVRDAAIKEADTPTTFIMSNFNKAPYIPSALYGIAIQTHQNVNVEIIDDISTDHSIAAIEKFSSLIDKNHLSINFSVNEKSRGTYWIRNSIIKKVIDSNHTYFINDSDDFSSCQRANIQLAIQEKFTSTAQICFGDIVRVDNEFTILPLDGKVERYGTASLGAPAAIHKKYGYYENVRKNADTEFIERLRHFSGKQSTKWFRYPVLFQPFDGNNLTSDIYKLQSNSVTQNLALRDLHKTLFTIKHKNTSLEEISKKETLPNFYSPLKGFVENSKPIVFAARKDGLGERLRAILNAIITAEILPVEFKFNWTDDYPYPNKELHAIPEKTVLFSEEFLKKYHLDDSLIESIKSKNFSDIESTDELLDTPFVLIQQDYILHKHSITKDKFHRNHYESAFKKIEFSNRFKEIISIVDSIKVSESAVAVHVRGGDLIAGDFKNCPFYLDKALPFPLINELIKECVNNGENIIIFGQDKEILEHLRERYSGLLASDFYNEKGMRTPTEKAFFDILLMSKCRRILASKSGFSLSASLISGAQFVEIQSIFNKEKTAAILSDFDFSNYQTIIPEEHLSYALLWHFKSNGFSLQDKKTYAIIDSLSIEKSCNSLLLVLCYFTFENFSNTEKARSVKNRLKELYSPSVKNMIFDRIGPGGMTLKSTINSLPDMAVIKNLFMY